jgi:flagellar basal body rod protein FlgC
MDAITTAATGLVGAANRVDAVATRLAQMGQPNSPDVDVARQMVDLVEAKTDYQANVAVIRTSNEMTGALLDMMA